MGKIKKIEGGQLGRFSPRKDKIEPTMKKAVTERVLKEGDIDRIRRRKQRRNLGGMGGGSRGASPLGVFAGGGVKKWRETKRPAGHEC